MPASPSRRRLSRHLYTRGLTDGRSDGRTGGQTAVMDRSWTTRRATSTTLLPVSLSLSLSFSRRTTSATSRHTTGPRHTLYVLSSSWCWDVDRPRPRTASWRSVQSDVDISPMVALRTPPDLSEKHTNKRTVNEMSPRVSPSPRAPSEAAEGDRRKRSRRAEEICGDSECFSCRTNRKQQFSAARYTACCWRCGGRGDTVNIYIYIYI